MSVPGRPPTTARCRRTTSTGSTRPGARRGGGARWRRPARRGAACSSRHRRTGRAAVAELARLGYADAILWVLDSNDRARRFYSIAGWREDGAVKTDNRLGFDLCEVRYRTVLGRVT